MTIVQLTISALIPILFASVFHFLEKKTKFSKINFWGKQTIVGIVFGIIACLATEFGIHYKDAVLNVRNAAPLTAGLVFGGPAGVIAGIIGGFHRWISVFWGVSEYSRVACTVATIFAGFLGATCRKFMFDNKRSSWLYGFIIGVTSEVVHMIILFLTKLDDISTAFHVIETCSIPMIFFNGFSVMGAMILITNLENEKVFEKIKKKSITSVVQIRLLASVLSAFMITTLFSFYLQTKLSEEETEALLSTNANSIPNTIENTTNSTLIQYTMWAATDFFADRTGNAKDDAALFEAILEEYDVFDMHYVDTNGKVIFSSDKNTIGKKVSKHFQPLIDIQNDGERVIVPYDEEKDLMQVGIYYENDGVFIIGFDAEFIKEQIEDHIHLAAKGQYIGKNGFIVICDENGNILSNGHDGFERNISELGLSLNTYNHNVVFKTDVYGIPSNCMTIEFDSLAGNFTIFALYPTSEALFSRDIAVYINVFMEVLVFAALFTNIYFLVKHAIVNNIKKVNTSLSKITSGDLETRVDVDESVEFVSLSNDINTTVETLKHYIDEAKARIDKDLEFAKNIQKSALPNVFPPFPHRHDFDIFAMMDPAKEVGGDFYDFYLLEGNRLGFLVADVSGKSIPGALFMMRSKTTLKNLAQTSIEVDEILFKANESLCEGNDAGMFVTAWIGIIDMNTGLLTYANAGHNPPIIRHGNGEFEYLRARPNFVLAGMEGARYRKYEYQLSPGDEIFLYTDGVTEAVDAQNELFGEERLLSALNRTIGLDNKSRCESIKKEIDGFAGDVEQFDDITMVSVSTVFFKNEDSIIVSSVSESTEEVWNFINKKLAKVGVSKRLENRAQIIVDEIFSNIVKYSDATVAEVFCSVDDRTLELKFTDNGSKYDPLAQDDPDITLSAEDRGIGGLGILVVKRMASRVEYEYSEEKNILHVTLPVGDQK